MVHYCHRHDLSIEIVPVVIHAPGDEEKNFFTIGYKFIHSATANKGIRDVSSSTPPILSPSPSSTDLVVQASTSSRSGKRNSAPSINPGMINK